MDLQGAVPLDMTQTEWPGSEFQSRYSDHRPVVATYSEQPTDFNGSAVTMGWPSELQPRADTSSTVVLTASSPLSCNDALRYIAAHQ